VSAPARPAPLDGILVLDLSRVLAGPYATMLLADLGARVVKIEDPRGGDVSRRWAPPSLDGEATYFLSINRRKESVAADLATEEGRELVRRLAARADVLVENFLPGTLDAWGLAIEDLRRENPRLVVCSISGFGETGPRAGEPGFDLLAQGATGLMSITGEADGSPLKAGVALSDVLTGWSAASAILAGLAARARDGVGCHARTDLFSTTLSALINVGTAALATGEEAARHGNGHPSLEPYRAFEAQDGPFLLAVGTDRQFAALCERVLEEPDLAKDERFLTNRARVENRGELLAVLSSAFRARPYAEWIALCRAAAIPAGEIAGVLDALRSPQAEALGSVLVTERGGRRVPTIAPPFRFPDLATPPAAAPPRLDEDGERVRAELRERLPSRK
jgi:crotonobetainyl-CoA:carnitine CoA-transferase CaiB-like acyl-CoA transferase